MSAKTTNAATTRLLASISVGKGRDTMATRRCGTLCLFLANPSRMSGTMVTRHTVATVVGARHVGNWL